MPILTKESLVFLNCEKTGYLECHIASWIWRFLPFILVVVGILGNILNIVILSRKRLRKKSTCVYLIVLAVSDTVVLFFGTFVEILRSVFGIYFYLWCAVSCILTEWIIYTAGIGSCWIIVLVTIERALVTLFPAAAKPKMTPRNALIASVIFLMAIALHNGHLLYAYTFTEVAFNATEKNETKFKVIKSCSLRKGEYTDFYNNTWSVMVFVTGSLLPIILIVIGNAVVGISMLKNRRALRLVRDVGISNVINARQDCRNDVGFSKKIFFILSGVFIFTTVPYGLYFVHLEYNKEISGHALARYQLASVLMKCLVWSNFSFNFLLYFMTGSLFKKEFKMLECVRKNIHSRAEGSTVYPVGERP